MSSGNKQQHTGGFTLIETLVALTISAVIALTMSQTFIIGMKHIRTIDADTKLLSAVAYTNQILTHRIHRVAEVNVSGNTVTIVEHDGGTLDLLVDGSSLKLGTDTLTPSDITVTAFSPEKIGESLHFTFTFQAHTGITRDLSGQMTFTPWK